MLRSTEIRNGTWVAFLHLFRFRPNKSQWLSVSRWEIELHRSNYRGLVVSRTNDSFADCFFFPVFLPLALAQSTRHKNGKLRIKMLHPVIPTIFTQRSTKCGWNKLFHLGWDTLSAPLFLSLFILCRDQNAPPKAKKKRNYQRWL